MGKPALKETITEPHPQEDPDILFLCNWGPHGAFQTLQEEGYSIPDKVKMIRIPCTGRIRKALLFKAFEMGADGVAVAGCAPGTCRYGSGTDNAVKNTEDTRAIIDLMGLGQDRLQLSSFLPGDAGALKAFSPRTLVSSLIAGNLDSEGVRNNIWSCLTCFTCYERCPTEVNFPLLIQDLGGAVQPADGDSGRHRGARP